MCACGWLLLLLLHHGIKRVSANEGLMSIYEGLLIRIYSVSVHVCALDDAF